MLAGVRPKGMQVTVMHQWPSVPYIHIYSLKHMIGFQDWGFYPCASSRTSKQASKQAVMITRLWKLGFETHKFSAGNLGPISVNNIYICTKDVRQVDATYLWDRPNCWMALSALQGSSRVRWHRLLWLPTLLSACRLMPTEAASLMMAMCFRPAMKASFSLMLISF